MELKRILARDTRSATEQALARFGPNVFVISNHRVGGQTELVVAVDVQATPPHDDEVVVQHKAPAPVGDFTQSMEVAQQQASQKLAPPVSASSQEAPQKEIEGTDDRDLIRSREIVATVREEIAALRQEFRLSQKAMMWQAQQQWPTEIQPLVEGLTEASVPASLRTLLLDALRDQHHLGAALDHLVQHLVSNMVDRPVAPPTQGLHIVMGPSGAGKTTMTARLVHHALQTLHPEQIAVIAFRDQRAGAWAQTLTLSAQMGVDCFRAKDAETLSTLLTELSPRSLVLIDTPGVQLTENMALLRQLCAHAQWHAVVPADVSAVTLRRVMSESPHPWSSLMVSKLDESSSPWPLLQHLMQPQHAVGLSLASGSERIGEGMQALSPALLAELAVAQWMPTSPLSPMGAQQITEYNTEFH